MYIIYIYIYIYIYYICTPINYRYNITLVLVVYHMNNIGSETDCLPGRIYPVISLDKH